MKMTLYTMLDIGVACSAIISLTTVSYCIYRTHAAKASVKGNEKARP